MIGWGRLSVGLKSQPLQQTCSCSEQGLRRNYYASSTFQKLDFDAAALCEEYISAKKCWKYRDWRLPFCAHTSSSSLSMMHSSLSLAVVIVSVVFPCLALFAVSLRLYAQGLNNNGNRGHVEDYFLIAGLVRDNPNHVRWSEPICNYSLWPLVLRP